MKKNNIKGTFSRWSKESVEWYETASEYTGYHDKLTEIISPYLKKTDTCCELACGTGTLARHLAPFTASYVANDIDPDAAEFLNGKLSSLPDSNISVLLGDWHEVTRNRQFNAVIFSYFGVVIGDWENLKRIAKDKVISIAPRKDAKKRRADENKIDSPKKVERNNGRSFETYSAVKEFLDEKNVSYDSYSLDLEFGQPFNNLDDAKKYVKYYYKLEGPEIDEFIELKFKKTDNGWYFPKRKEIGIVIADMTSAG